MNKVILSSVEGIENAYVSTSAYRNKDDELSLFTVLLYMETNDMMVEWEPIYGPITRITKCDKLWTGEYEWQKSSPHWYFGWCKGRGDWAQLAVDDNGLQTALTDGNFEHIFNVLKRYYNGSNV